MLTLQEHVILMGTNNSQKSLLVEKTSAKLKLTGECRLLEYGRLLE